MNREGPHHPHAHSHRTRRRGPRVYTEAEFMSRVRRLERRRERQANPPPAAGIARAVVRILEYPPAGQQRGQIGRNPDALPWYVREALNRQARERAQSGR